MAFILVAILDSEGLSGIYDAQGTPYGTVPETGYLVTVEDTHPEIGNKLWAPTNGIIQLEELAVALDAYWAVLLILIDGEILTDNKGNPLVD